MLKQSTLVSADTPATMNAKLEKQDRLQSDNCALGDVFEVWMDLRCQIPEEYQDCQEVRVAPSVFCCKLN